MDGASYTCYRYTPDMRLNAESEDKFRKLDEIKVFGVYFGVISTMYFILGFVFIKIGWIIHLVILMHSAGFGSRSET